jgi:hypothetical protein
MTSYSDIFIIQEGEIYQIIQAPAASAPPPAPGTMSMARIEPMSSSSSSLTSQVVNTFAPSTSSRDVSLISNKRTGTDAAQQGHRRDSAVAASKFKHDTDKKRRQTHKMGPAAQARKQDPPPRSIRHPSSII